MSGLDRHGPTNFSEVLRTGSAYRRAPRAPTSRHPTIGQHQIHRGFPGHGPMPREPMPASCSPQFLHLVQQLTATQIFINCMYSKIQRFFQLKVFPLSGKGVLLLPSWSPRGRLNPSVTVRYLICTLRYAAMLYMYCIARDRIRLFIQVVGESGNSNSMVAYSSDIVLRGVYLFTC